MSVLSTSSLFHYTKSLDTLIGILSTGLRFSTVREPYPQIGYGESIFTRILDSDLAHARLGREQAESDDPRWQWSLVTERHFTECREYSLFGDMTATKPGRKRSAARSGLSAKLRWQVFSRDNFVCRYCGRRPPDVALEVDHRISVADGGNNDIENLITACVDCNRGKGPESR